MKKLVFKKHLCLKSKQSKRHIRYIKDKAIKNFLLQHLTPVKIDFSKMKNCLLNQIIKEESIMDKIFPEIKETNSETNMQLKNSLSNFKCNKKFY